MRIGIDARELTGKPTGVGRYLSGLLAEWVGEARSPQHDFVLYTHEPLPPGPGAGHVTTRVLPGPGGTWWEQVRLPSAMERDRLDVFFSPGYTAPLRTAVPTVVAIHDLSFAVHPEWFGMREGLRRRWLTRRAAQAARAVVTISRFTASELHAVYNLPGGRVHVVPPGITPPACGPRREAGPRVLYAGSIFNRRHVPDLIRAFEPLARAHADASLEIVGDNRSRPYQDLVQVIHEAGLTGQVRWRRWLPDAELGALYGSARAFAFLSAYEGLGLTPLEALSVGVPPVLLDTAVARESCGDAALYVPADDIQATTAALGQLLYDPAMRGQLLAAAPEVVGRYRWPRAAAETLGVIEQAGRT